MSMHYFIRIDWIRLTFSELNQKSRKKCQSPFKAKDAK